MEWDESLHGELALEMLNNGRYFSYYFGGVHETWFAKPPLAIWAITGSYAFFGTNEFALRLPSALAIIASFYFIFQICRIHKNVAFAFWTTLMLITVNGLIGPHVGRTGDTDAMLVLFLLAASWSFLLYIDKGHRLSGLLIGVFLGLAFWTKGPAALVLLPAWLIYALITKRLITLLKSWTTYAALGLFTVFVAGWVWALSNFGVQFQASPFMGSNSLEVMLNYDILHRFLGKGDIGGSNDLAFFFTCVDSKLSLWIYAGYLLFLVAIIQRKIPIIFAPGEIGHFQLFCFLSWFVLSLFLTFASSNHIWYLAPVLPFLAINIWALISHYINAFKPLAYAVFGLFVVTLIIKVEYLANPQQQDSFMTENLDAIEEAEKIIFQSAFPCDRFLFAHFRNPSCILDSLVLKKTLEGSTLYVMRTEDMETYHEAVEQLTIVASDEQNAILRLVDH